MKRFEQSLLQDYFQNTELSPLLRFRFNDVYSSHGSVMRNLWIISFLSRKITVNPKTYNVN